MKQHHNKAVDNDNKMTNLLDSNKGKDKEAGMCHFLRMLTTATTGAMTMTVEATVAKVVGVAISQQDTEERGRWEAHNNQLKLNDNDAVYNNNERNDNAMFNKNVASGIAIGQMPA
jgi:hypothetical protein